MPATPAGFRTYAALWAVAGAAYAAIGAWRLAQGGPWLGDSRVAPVVLSIPGCLAAACGFATAARRLAGGGPTAAGGKAPVPEAGARDAAHVALVVALGLGVVAAPRATAAAYLHAAGAGTPAGVGAWRALAAGASAACGWALAAVVSRGARRRAAAAHPAITRADAARS